MEPVLGDLGLWDLPKEERSNSTLVRRSQRYKIVCFSDRLVPGDFRPESAQPPRIRAVDRYVLDEGRHEGRLTSNLTRSLGRPSQRHPNHSSHSSTSRPGRSFAMTERDALDRGERRSDVEQPAAEALPRRHRATPARCRLASSGCRTRTNCTCRDIEIAHWRTHWVTGHPGPRGVARQRPYAGGIEEARTLRGVAVSRSIWPFGAL
jgi:hypothetical protein